MSSYNERLYIPQGRAEQREDQHCRPRQGCQQEWGSLLSFNCSSFVQIFREWIYLPSSVSESVFGTSYAPVQCCGSWDSTNQPFQINQDPGFWWPKIKKKKIQLKLFLNLIFWSKIAIYLFLCLHKGRPNYRRSLQPSKENILHFKTWNFLTFLKFCRSFCPPGTESGLTDLIESGSNPDWNTSSIHKCPKRALFRLDLE